MSLNPSNVHLSTDFTIGLFDDGKILEGEKHIATWKHVHICPLGMAHVQSPNGVAIPTASPSFPACCTRGACYATSPQSDGEGSLEGEASGGWVLQAQMATSHSFL